MSDQKKKFVPADNPVEQMRDAAADVIREVPKAIVDEALEQIGLKPRKKPLVGEISLLSGIHKTNQQIETKGTSIDARIRQLQAVQQKEREVYSVKQKAVEAQVAKLMQELALEVRKLEQQTAELTSEIRQATVEVAPVKPGIYHLNFFDWVIGTLRDLRKKINESRLWLNVWTQKKRQKSYWAMYKKHGMKFAASDERGIATAGG